MTKNSNDLKQKQAPGRKEEQELLEDMQEQLKRMTKILILIGRDIEAIKNVAIFFGILGAIGVLIVSCSMLGL